MANHKSSIKKNRQNVMRRLRNRGQRSRLRTTIKKLLQTIAAGETEQAKQMLPGTLSLIDKTAQSGAIESNAGRRTKSRLAKAINRASAAA